MSDFASLIMKCRVTTTPKYYGKVVKMGVGRTDYSGNSHLYWCVMFGKVADNAVKVLSKGDLVIIMGEPKGSQYEQDGETRTDHDINVFKFDLLAKNEKNAAPNPSPPSGDPSKGEKPF